MGEAKRPKRVRDRGALPPGCAILLSREQIWTAIGVSERTFDGMVSGGEYPRADARIGAFPRWKLETHNAWVAAQCQVEGS